MKPDRRIGCWNRCQALLPLLTLLLLGSPAARPASADDYQQRIEPFVKKYCVECHNEKEARADLDLTRYRQASDVTGSFRRWHNVIEFIRSGEMPPEDAKQPTLAERNAVAETVEGILLTEAKRRAGDPGLVLPRRLSNTEYDLSVRDLTGVDIRPTEAFPADPAAGEGFDNTGEALTMSPNLLKKYLAAAQQVSHHLVLKPHGITFAPFPVTSYNERKKLTEQAIIDFYDRHAVRTRDYLVAAWRYRYRDAGDKDATIQAWASRQGLSPRYLAIVWETLNETSAGAGYLQQIGQQWQALPPPIQEGAEAGPMPKELGELERLIDFARNELGHDQPQLIRSNAGNWPISHLDFRAQQAALRDKFDPANFQSQRLLQFDRLRAPKEKDPPGKPLTLTLRIDPAFGADGNYVLMHKPVFSKSTNLPRNEDEIKRHEVVTLRAILEQHAPDVARRLAFGLHPQGGEIDADSYVAQAPALIEIPLSPAAIIALNDKQLLVECQLDPERSREGCVRVQHAAGKQLDDPQAFGGELLLHADSALAGKLTPAAERLCRAFPSRFYYVDGRRGLAAGFHLVEGFFRDDRPLVEKVLNDAERRELDNLWEELHFVTQSAETLLRGFVWFERSERHVLHDERFDFLRAEDPLLVEEALLTRFERVYLGKMGVKLLEESLEPAAPDGRFDMIHGFFAQIRQGLAHHRQLTASAEQQGMADLEKFAERTYRRSLRPDEAASLRKLQQTLRQQGQSAEGALRGVLTAILMSPDFCYRYTATPPGTGVYPLSDQELASRLSYFLWSSLPDDQLLAAANAGKLHEAGTLAAQTRRMLKDPRTSSFAREFLGQWLRYRDYLTNDSIIAETFPGYTDELRQAMFEEPVRLATYLIQEDRPITDLLSSDITFVNATLASHYGGDIASQYAKNAAAWRAEQQRLGQPVPEDSNEVWQRVEGLRSAGRGGLFGMGVILTKNSAGERTSPVKRGFWTVHHLLGQHFPPPPAEVGELPKNEKEATKTIRELLAEHAASPKCAMCHVHFDGLGLALEGFDPIGRARTKDLGGRPIDDVAQLPNGETARGIPGLIDYIEQHRRRDFVRTICRKFLGYALGRSVMLSDQPLLNEMEAALERNDYRFSVMFEMVVASPQFRQQRGREFVAAGR